MTDRLDGFTAAALIGVPAGSFTAGGLRIDLGGGVRAPGRTIRSRKTVPRTAVPSVMPVAPLGWLSAPGMYFLACRMPWMPCSSRIGATPKALTEEADERAGKRRDEYRGGGHGRCRSGLACARRPPGTPRQRPRP